MRIYNNVNAINVQNSLSMTNRAMQKSLEKLSTGLRINRASDDAAGLSVSEGLRTQIRGSKMASRKSRMIESSGTQWCMVSNDIAAPHSRHGMPSVGMCIPNRPSARA